MVHDAGIATTGRERTRSLVSHRSRHVAGASPTKPIEVTLRDGSRPRARPRFAEANVMVFRKAQERSGRILVRVSMGRPH